MATSQWSSSSAWSPLKPSIFRALWLASLTSNIGLWMQNVECGTRLVNDLPFLISASDGSAASGNQFTAEKLKLVLK